jgi:prepilin-type processing-associated H-X9-DG protein
MKTPSPKTERAFSLIEILVVTGIAAFLVALLVPAVSRSVDAGKRTRCTANLRQIGLGVANYANDHDGKVPYLFDPAKPGEEFWYDAVCASLALPSGSWWQDKKGLFRCPAAKTPVPNYTMSWSMTDRKVMSVTNAPQRVIIADGDGASGAGINESAPFGGLEAKRHVTGANYLFVDGHVEFLATPPTDGLTPLN